MAATPKYKKAIGNKTATTLASGISDSDLTISVASASGMNATGGYVIIDEGVDGKEEAVYIESVSGTTLTVSSDGRGREGTTAVAHDTGATLTDILVVSHINSIIDGIDDVATGFAAEHESDGTHKSTLIESIINTIYPVGSIYTSTLSTNPATLLGIGTWVAFGAGRVMIGHNAADTDFDVAEETGGAKTASLTATNNGPHTHTVDPGSTTTSSNGDHSHAIGGDRDVASGSGGPYSVSANDSYNIQGWMQTTGAHTHTLDIAAFDTVSSGSGTAFSIMNPYIVVYSWKRTE